MFEKSVQGLVDSAVTANRDDFHVPVAQRVTHHVGGLGWRGGDEKVHQGKDPFQRFLDLAPVAPAFAAVRIGIEDDEGSHVATCQLRSRAWISRAFLSSSQPSCAAMTSATLSIALG